VNQLQGWEACSRLDAKNTMERMRANIRASLHHKKVYHKAREIVQRIAPRDELAQARKIRDWASAHFHFVKDPLGIELLETPGYLVAQIEAHGSVQGDCDDAASLTSALAAAVGIPVTLYALAFNDPHAPYSHVIAVAHPLDSVKHRRTEQDFDITRPPDMALPRISRKLAVTV
jgi:transglutaminase-like putative cysteine protease